MIKQDYKIVAADNFVLLEKAVEVLLADHWVLVGGVAGSFGQGFMQAMYKE